MGLFDKFKDLFTEPDDDDEEEEVKVEQIKKEPTRVRSESKQTETRRERLEPEKPIVKEEPKIEEPEEKPKATVFFTENDFADLEPEKPKKVERKPEPEPRPVKREEKKQSYGTHYTGTYTSTSILTQEKPSFKPTPIISPIYGILDKNYSKDDIVERKEPVMTQVADGMVQDKFDEVRNKAFGTLEKDLEETMYDDHRTSRAERNKNIEEEIDLFDELEQDRDSGIRLEDTAELAKTVNEQEKNIRELEEITMDLTKELDNLLLKKESFNSQKEKVAMKRQELAEKNDQLTENELFNLIDSMYEEGKE